MPEYINRSELAKGKYHPLPYTHITPPDVDVESYKRGWNDAIDAAIDAIPAAEVVEVVRCWECIFWDTSWEPGVGIKGYCPRCHLVTLKDSFCSGACRKDGGQDDG